MKLLTKTEIKSIKHDQLAKESMLNKQRRDRILEDIAKFNHRKDILEKSIAALEQEFEIFCLQINEKRKALTDEVEALEKRKDALLSLNEQLTNLTKQI